MQWYMTIIIEAIVLYFDLETDNGRNKAQNLLGKKFYMVFEVELRLILDILFHQSPRNISLQPPCYLFKYANGEEMKFVF